MLDSPAQLNIKTADRYGILMIMANECYGRLASPGQDIYKSSKGLWNSIKVLLSYKSCNLPAVLLQAQQGGVGQASQHAQLAFLAQRVQQRLHAVQAPLHHRVLLQGRVCLLQYSGLNINHGAFWVWVRVFIHRRFVWQNKVPAIASAALPRIRNVFSYNRMYPLFHQLGGRDCPPDTWHHLAHTQTGWPRCTPLAPKGTPPCPQNQLPQLPVVIGLPGTSQYGLS